MRIEVKADSDDRSDITLIVTDENLNNHNSVDMYWMWKDKESEDRKVYGETITVPTKDLYQTIKIFIGLHGKELDKIIDTLKIK